MKKIKLRNNKYTLVDDEDFEYLNQWKWSYSKHKKSNTGYAVTFGRKRGDNILMHRLVVKAPKGKWVDHINHNGLDNRKQNLRLCLPWQNQANRTKNKNNTSGICGVSWNKIEQKWRVRICHKGERLELGDYKNKKDAILVRKYIEKKLKGEYAP